MTMHNRQLHDAEIAVARRALDDLFAESQRLQRLSEALLQDQNDLKSECTRLRRRSYTLREKAQVVSG
ncbi:MAG: hypothetical protein AAFX45_12230 [Pseudomonadota bacterium]